jgi:hypothetical protein
MVNFVSDAEAHSGGGIEEREKMDTGDALYQTWVKHRGCQLLLGHGHMNSGVSARA